MNLVNLINFKSLGDERGDLVALEGNSEIPFDIKRVYYIFGTAPEVSRGFHAHKELVQVAICVAGSCIILMDDGRTKESITLNTPKYGVLIDKMQWHEMHDFSHDCVLLVLASDCYEENDYIRDYKNFIEKVEILND
jgi:dTDP-4-dehydrorhamnose 3,5-epimerase-like enzyme